MKPFVSVVIPSKDRGQSLQRTLSSVLKQKYPSFEVIVINQGNKPNKALKSNKINWIYDDGAGQPRAQNMGIRKAKGEIILFLDDDVECFPGLIENHVKNYGEKAVAAVAGRANSKGDKPMGDIKEIGKLNRIDLSMSSNFNADFAAEVDQVYGCNWSARKSVLKEVGLFDENFHLNGRGFQYFQEAELAYRIKQKGYRIVFDPHARVNHLQSDEGLAYRRFDYAEMSYWFYHNKMIFFLKHVNKLFLPWFLFRQKMSILKRSLQKEQTGKTFDFHLILKSAQGLVDGTRDYYGGLK